MERYRGRIGVIVPSSNTNLEPDFFLLVPSGVTIHFTRIGGYDLDVIPDTDEMRKFATASLGESIRQLMDANVNVIAYGCTSATLSSGPDFDRSFANDIETIAGVPVVTAANALVEALSVLGISKISFTSPYTKDLNDEAVKFLETSGIEVVNRAEAGNLTSREQGELTPEFVYKIGRKADHPDAEGLVISCTDFRAVEALLTLEHDLGKPVITSNQALMYACLLRLGVDTSEVQEGGYLFTIRSKK